ncbi:MAG: hypothetical protein KatS3mg110_3920 [Pirellulaceae bacterium]|nr:MAG: hypothetical protein KatS3mg110_3920 [Pirellulaceae bacterium]
MRQAFFLFLIAFVAVATIGWLAWLVGQALYTMWQDRRLYRELDALENWSKQRKTRDTSADAAASDSVEP